MKYQEKRFTVPVGGKASQEDWDRVFGEKQPEPCRERICTWVYTAGRSVCLECGKLVGLE